MNSSVPLLTQVFIICYSNGSTRTSSSFHGPIFLQSLQKTLNRTQYQFFWFVLFTYLVGCQALFFIIVLMVALALLENTIAYCLKYLKKQIGKVPGNRFLSARESSKTDTIILLKFKRFQERN